MKISIEGYTSLAGTPTAILQLLQDARIFDTASGNDLIEEIVHTAWRCFGVGLQVDGNNYSERAESLLREMARANMITIEGE